jgi:hypothetical protein
MLIPNKLAPAIKLSRRYQFGDRFARTWADGKSGRLAMKSEVRLPFFELVESCCFMVITFGGVVLDESEVRPTLELETRWFVMVMPSGRVAVDQAVIARENIM